MWYAKVENNEVTKIREFDGPDAVLEPKLLVHGYRIGEDGNPSYDPATQVRSTIPIYDIQATKVVRAYLVVDKTALVDYGKVEGSDITDVQKDVFEPTVITKLTADGYLPIEDGDSSYDPMTQTRASDPTYDIQVDKVVRTYTVTDKPLPDCKEAQLNHVRGLAAVNTINLDAVWVSEEKDAIDALTTPQEVRDYTPTEPDYDAIATKQQSAISEMLTSQFAGKTYAQIEAYVENTVTDLASAKEVLKKMAKIILALIKVQAID